MMITQTTYTVAWHTYYNDAWHMDPATETEQMCELMVIVEGRKMNAIGACPFYYEWINGMRGQMMYEYNGHLEYAAQHI